MVTRLSLHQCVNSELWKNICWWMMKNDMGTLGHWDSIKSQPLLWEIHSVLGRNYIGILHTRWASLNNTTAGQSVSPVISTWRKYKTSIQKRVHLSFYFYLFYAIGRTHGSENATEFIIKKAHKYFPTNVLFNLQ